MSGYRFCRTDDIPLLVEAYNACAGDVERLTVADFKHAAREIGLWASSCMLAFEGETPIGVLLGAKTEEANFIYRIVVREDRRHLGHGRHLVDSLKRKCAILGPPWLVTEVRSDLIGVRRFFECCGFVEGPLYADLVLDALPAEASPLVSDVSVDDLLDADVMDRAIDRSWQRSLAVIRRRSREIEGLAIASDIHIEAYLLHRQNDIVAIAASQPELFIPLLRALCYKVGVPLRMPRVAETEAPAATMASLGFRREVVHMRYTAQIVE
jgi:GNAT superfamily N-acetyltransferase